MNTLKAWRLAVARSSPQGVASGVMLQAVVVVAAAVACLCVGSTSALDRSISMTNKCDFPVWMGQTLNSETSPLPGGSLRVSQGQTHRYSIPDSGWAGWLWPKTGCRDDGTNCVMGDSVPPCPASGCQPPADIKVEFFFPASSSGQDSFYDVSLVDGYTLPVKIVPRVVPESGSCVTTTCALALSECPCSEISGLGDLRVRKDGTTIACLAPCKKWNWPTPLGLGRPEIVAPGVDMCCPTPPITVDQCRTGPVVQTQFVKLLRKQCPTAYSYAYDDEGGNHNCPVHTSYDVTICPDGAGSPSSPAPTVPIPTCSGDARARVQGALDWLCGADRASCSRISPGAACSSPDTHFARATYAFHSWYAKRGPAEGTNACVFGGAAKLVSALPAVGWPASCPALTPINGKYCVANF